ncbi:DUF3179 domain-containing protein [Haloarcula salina]|uniref:DUF3179 domain-containing protein n=1 Tax=Haloarcula salina TaxID=1429914 RepID=A0AA41G2M6_9EURY|nr:DUF3179 domain-containing protein [Haloarcula salina]MBV0903045.1 DUF3179 domain-containing protein [Haloarcula salina]
MARRTRRRFLAAAALSSLAGCVGQDTAGDSTEPPPSTESTDPTPRPQAVPTADERLPLPMEPARLREQARSGGPPKDGIPSIDEPAFVDAEAADFIDPGDPVFGVARDGTAKAYPQKILAHHEIVNDELAGTNVAVTYCPLTGTVQGFERGQTTFGVSGRLLNANLVMYDRATETWWPQMLATAIPGPWNESPQIRSLREFRLVWTTWERWREHRPATRVLSTESGHARNYQRDPYGSYNPRRGYYESDSLLFPPLHESDRFPRKTVVMGARTPDGAVAFLKDALATRRVMTGTLGTDPALAVYDPHLDTGYVYLNPAQHAYEADGDEVVGPDGTTHAPGALPLEEIHTFDAMWFAWAGYYPNTNVYG